MFRSPSLTQLWHAAGQAFRRFPFVLGAAIVAAVAGVLSIDGPLEGDHGRRWMTATLGLPLFLAVALFAEKEAIRHGRRLALNLTGAALLVGFYLVWPGFDGPSATVRYLQYSFGLHLLVAVLPFATAGQLNGFWQFNRALFLRFLFAVLYSGVLYVGLAVALLALDKLFGIRIDGDLYVQLWVLIAVLFNTWFFLGGVPDDLATLDNDALYPKGLKIFAQYILSPLVVVYLLILTAYLVRIVATTSWPSGWIGYLVSSVSVIGILSLLLVYPIRNHPGNQWIGRYTRWFYLALSPSIVMVLLAIWQRVDQYGVTERRYVILILALWLAGIAAFYTLTRSDNIKVIPASLCILAFVTSAGPWGVFGV
jgi:hypothetical protein